MNKKHFFVAVALLVLIIFTFIGWQKNKPNQSSIHKPLVQNLTKKLNDIESIAFIQNDKTLLNFIKRDNQWLLKQADNYPADVSKVRTLLLEIVDSKLLEAKTDNPNLLNKLGLDSVSRLTIQSFGANQEQLFSLVLGDVGNKVAGTYVLLDQKKEAPKAWLTSGDLRPITDSNHWLQLELFDIAPNSIRSITLDHTKENVQINNQGDTKFVIADLSEKEKAHTSNIQKLTTVYKKLEFLSVVSEDTQPETTPALTSTTTTTTDTGLIITAQASKTEDSDSSSSYWVKFITSVDSKAIHIDNSTDTIDAILNHTTQNQQKLEQRFSGRLFRVSENAGQAFTFTRADLLEQPTKQEKK